MAKKTRRAPNSSDRLQKAQLSLYLEPEEYAALKALSARTGVPQQVYLRGGLAYILQLNEVSSSSLQVAARSGRKTPVRHVTGKAHRSRHK